MHSPTRPADAPPFSATSAALLVVLCNESLWYGSLALTFASAPVRRAYRRVKVGLERTFGVILMRLARSWCGMERGLTRNLMSTNPNSSRR
jgi:hypothetical protein